MRSFLCLFVFVSVISSFSVAADNRAVNIAGQDHLRPFKTYFEIKAVMGKAVSKGRVELFKVDVVELEGIQNICIQFDLTAPPIEVAAVKTELLAIGGVSESLERASVGLLTTGLSCPTSE